MKRNADVPLWNYTLLRIQVRDVLALHFELMNGLNIFVKVAL